MVVRPRTDDDLPGCVAVLRAVHAADRYPSTWPADPAAFLSPPGLVTALVVTVGERVTGHAALLTDDVDAAGDSGALRLTRVFVDPAVRRAGYARALLAGVATALAARGRVRPGRAPLPGGRLGPHRGRARRMALPGRSRAGRRALPAADHAAPNG